LPSLTVISYLLKLNTPAKDEFFSLNSGKTGSG